MTLTILDPCSGEQVTISVENVPAMRQPVAAKVVTIRPSRDRLRLAKIQ